MKTLTIFGDSISKGIVYQDGKLSTADNTTVDILSRELNININNCSVYGQTLSRLVKKGIIEKYVKEIDPENENIAAFCIGGNDADYDWPAVAANPLDDHPSKTPHKTFYKLLDEEVKLLKAHNIKVYLLTLPPVNSERYFNNVISKVANGEEVLKFLHDDLSNIYRHQELMDLEILRCAKNNKVEVIDIRSCFLQERDYLSYFCEDGVHLTQEGQSFLADIILESVRPNKEARQ